MEAESLPRDSAFVLSASRIRKTDSPPFQGGESISLMSRLSPAVMTVLKAVEHSDVSVLLSIQLVAGILLPTRFTNRPDIYIRSNQGFF